MKNMHDRLDILLEENAAIQKQKHHLANAKAYGQLPAFQAPRMGMAVNLIDGLLVTSNHLIFDFYQGERLEILRTEMVFSSLGVARRFIKYCNALGVKVELCTVPWRSYTPNCVGLGVDFTLPINEEESAQYHNDMFAMHFQLFLAGFIDIHNPVIEMDGRSFKRSNLIEVAHYLLFDDNYAIEDLDYPLLKAASKEWGIDLGDLDPSNSASDDNYALAG